MERFYMVFADNKQAGPYSVSQLENLRQNGEVPVSALVWTEGMADWQPLASVLPEAAAPRPAMKPVPVNSGTSGQYVVSESDYTFVLIAHILMGVAILTGGLSSIIAVIMAYVKRNDVGGTYLESHCKWIAETFWWTFWLSIAGGILTFVGIGFLILIGVWVWSIYRVIVGVIRISERRAL
jgi:uncharacterized membrane protein